MAKKLITLFTLLFLIAGFSLPAQADDKNLIIATATTGGTYYPVGVAIGTLISIKLAGKHKITATAINSAGSGENVQMLKNKETDLASFRLCSGLRLTTAGARTRGARSRISWP